MLRYILTVLCTVTLAYAETQLIGTYELQVDINGRSFIDILEIATSSKGKLTGNFEVPSVFKVPFEGILEDEMVRGSFIALERGEKFQVNLKAQVFENGDLLKGELRTNNEVFGTFIGIKRAHHE